jgi:hypothetical protein
MSKAPQWPKRMFDLGKTEEGHRKFVKVHPMNPYGPVTEVVVYEAGGECETRMPPDQQLGWLLVYYLPYVAEVIHETNELVREVLADARDFARALRRVAFWRRRK